MTKVLRGQNWGWKRGQSLVWHHVMASTEAEVIYGCKPVRSSSSLSLSLFCPIFRKSFWSTRVRFNLVCGGGNLNLISTLLPTLSFFTCWNYTLNVRKGLLFTAFETKWMTVKPRMQKKKNVWGGQWETVVGSRCIDRVLWIIDSIDIGEVSYARVFQCV